MAMMTATAMEIATETAMATAMVTSTAMARIMVGYWIPGYLTHPCYGELTLDSVA